MENKWNSLELDRGICRTEFRHALNNALPVEKELIQAQLDKLNGELTKELIEECYEFRRKIWHIITDKRQLEFEFMRDIGH